jgi:hypothetical protein
MGRKSTAPIWERPNPKKKTTHLTASEKRRAAASARRHGRSKPSLVENINAKKKR